MATCASCRELLLDQLYGLVEPAEAETLRAHLAGCPACREALAQAERQQKLLAAAAQIYREVPLFLPPSSEPVPQAPAPESAPATLPLSAARRKRPVLRWAVTAAAAAVLLGAVGLLVLYRNGVKERQEQLADARAQVKKVETKLADVRDGLERKLSALPDRLRDKVFQVEADGPAIYQPGVAARLHVRTRDLLQDRPLAATVSARLLEGKKVVFEKTIPSDGQVTVTLPAKVALRPGALARLEVEAKGPGGTQTLQQALMIEAPAYLAQLVVSQARAKPGDAVFFRALLLERFSLRPPNRPLPLRWTLTDPQGKVVWQEAQACQPDGVAAGRLLLPPNLTDGEYTLRIAPVGPAQFASQAQRLRVQRVPEAKRRPAAAAQAKLSVDFFPEGGELLAGVPSRVYFRVLTPPGQSAQLEGHILDRQGRLVAQVQTTPAGKLAADEALGVFTLTPEAGQSYRLQITVPAGVKETPTLPNVQIKGVSLSVADAVAREGEPIRATVHATDKERRLLVLAECRGQVVDEQFVIAGPAGRGVRLDPVQGTRGVVRVTVYDPSAGKLLPLAERLVYREPARRLAFSVNKLDQPYHPRQALELDVSAKTETGKFTSARALAVVVAQRALQGTDKQGEAGPPAHFFLLGSVPDAANLENANLLVRDSAESRKALDLFLGSYGWRRFVPAEGGPLVALAGSQQQRSAGKDTPAVFHFSNAAAARKTYNRVLARQQKELRDEAARQRAPLLQEKEHQEEAVRTAIVALADFERLPAQYTRLTLGLLAVALLLAGALALLLGLVRALRGRGVASGPLAAAFASLAVCLLLYALRGSLPLSGPNDRDSTTGPLAWKGQGGRLEQEGEGQVKYAPEHRGLPNRVLVASAVPQKAAQRQALAAQADASLNRADRVAQSKMQRRREGGASHDGAGKATESMKLNSASAKGAFRATVPGGGVSGAVPDTAPHPGGTAPAPAAGFRGGPRVAMPVLRQYIHQAPALRPDRQELLLWLPDLDLSAGRASLRFALSDLATDYRILLFGHDATGRLGFAERTLHIQAAPK
jgi:hypothetical protein